MLLNCMYISRLFVRFLFARLLLGTVSSFLLTVAHRVASEFLEASHGDLHSWGALEVCIPLHHSDCLSPEGYRSSRCDLLTGV